MLPPALTHNCSPIAHLFPTLPLPGPSRTQHFILGSYTAPQGFGDTDLELPRTAYLGVALRKQRRAVTQARMLAPNKGLSPEQ